MSSFPLREVVTPDDHVDREILAPAEALSVSFASEPEPTQTTAPAALSAYAGGQIVFTSSRDGDNEIYLMDADGSNQVNLSNMPNAGDGQPVIGPNGKIAFISDRDGNLEIYTMDRDGGNQVRLTNAAGDEGWMDWSPDGTTIAFYRADSINPGIYTIPASGGAEKLLPLGVVEEPDWSPDGTRLAVTRVDYVKNKSWIFVTDLDGSNPVQVSPGTNFTLQAGKRTGGGNWRSWSPDGRRIVYASDWGGGFEMVYVTMADGSNAGSHTNLSARQPPTTNLTGGRAASFPRQFGGRWARIRLVA